MRANCDCYSQAFKMSYAVHRQPAMGMNGLHAKSYGSNILLKRSTNEQLSAYFLLNK